MKYRLKSGVASSLNYVNLTNAQNEKSPKLIPYPDWSKSFLNLTAITTNKTQPSTSPATSANGTSVDASAAPPAEPKHYDHALIISAFQIHVDQCDRLWVLDTGSVDILGKPEPIVPSALVIFNLKTNELILRKPFDEKVYDKKNSILANMVSVVNSKNYYCIVVLFFFRTIYRSLTIQTAVLMHMRMYRILVATVLLFIRYIPIHVGVLNTTFSISIH